MKKIVLIFLGLISLISLRVSGSHLMGGQITVSQVSGMNYEISMYLYRDMTGIPISPTATFFISNVLGGFAQQVTANYSGPSTVLNGVEVYEYLAPITFPFAGTF